MRLGGSETRVEKTAGAARLHERAVPFSGARRGDERNGRVGVSLHIQLAAHNQFGGGGAFRVEVDARSALYRQRRPFGQLRFAAYDDVSAPGLVCVQRSCFDAQFAVGVRDRRAVDGESVLYAAAACRRPSERRGEKKKANRYAH